MKKLRWGVIGAGGIADRRTIPGMMLAENAELIAVMDINAEQVEKIRQKYGAKRGYTKEEDLLAEVQRLRAENEYLKKLSALVRKRMLKEEKKQQ